MSVTILIVKPICESREGLEITAVKRNPMTSVYKVCQFAFLLFSIISTPLLCSVLYMGKGSY